MSEANNNNKKNGIKSIYGAAVGGISGVGIIGYTVVSMLSPTLSKIDERIIEGNSVIKQELVELKVIAVKVNRLLDMEDKILEKQEKILNEIRRTHYKTLQSVGSHKHAGK